MLRLKRKLESVVIIDDEYVDNFISEAILKRMDITDRIMKYESPVEALSYFESVAEDCGNGPDLVLLDINMPVMNGWEFLDKLRSIKLINETIIVMLSSSSNSIDLKKAEEAPEVSLFITKPLTKLGMEEILTVNFSNFLH